MTDVFKLVPTRDGTAPQKQIKADKPMHDHVARCAALLRVELEICTRGNSGTPPLLVALGGHAYDGLTGKKPGSRPIMDAVASVFGSEVPRIAKINHASASRPDPERTAQLIKILTANAQSFISKSQAYPSADSGSPSAQSGALAISLQISVTVAVAVSTTISSWTCITIRCPARSTWYMP